METIFENALSLQATQIGNNKARYEELTGMTFE